MSLNLINPPLFVFLNSSRRRSISRSVSPVARGNPIIRVERLTKNVTIKHLEEIFEVYGKIIEVELPISAKR